MVWYVDVKAMEWRSNAFRFFVTTILVLIYLVQPDGELDE